MTNIEKKVTDQKDVTAENLRNRRVELGLTQEEVANKCGWHRETISRIEGGKFFLNTRQLWILCDALNLTFSISPRKG